MQTFSSNYVLDREEVEAFANEVASNSQKKSWRTVMEEDGEEEIAVTTEKEGNEGEIEGQWVVKNAEIGGGGVDGVTSVCVERWKANADDSKKGMLNCFEESGIFVACCRHGFILIACDMVASGELAKYPLAVLSHVSRKIPGKKMIGYDIGCAFKKTVARSSITGLEDVQWVVPAMHGYAHNRHCQLSHHPKYVLGAGLEDFETCERTFSFTNHCAAVTRLAMPFHRLQTIDAQFRQYDADKYASLGSFILNNYKQALNIVEEYGDIFSQLYNLEHIKSRDFEKWNAEEEAYLSGLKKEPEEETLAIAYAEALDKWQATKAEHEAEHSRLNLPPTDSTSGDLGKRRVKQTYKAVYEKVGQCLELVCELEAQLGGGPRWTVETEEYIKAKELLRTRKYRLALDHLESLVVQRLFELQKGHLASTGK
ncbi:hypothetical protein FRC02_006489 [Tulasnella sp. 418]|nr:hypothetical protein FRC02_006489 [Tulasnella sp. 418]